MLGACREPDPARNPGVSLGLAMGGLARAGRDKLTFLADAEIASFGAWAEQLIAESTGKRGVGIVPVDLEPLGTPASYGTDRAFVRSALDGRRGRSAGRPRRWAGGGGSAGDPDRALYDPIDLGGEMVRWEVATAIAGAVLGIDPFDQPNVEEAKELTRRVLDARDPLPRSGSSTRPTGQARTSSTRPSGRRASRSSPRATGSCSSGCRHAADRRRQRNRR